MKKKPLIKISLFLLIPVIFILLIVFTNNKLRQCGRDPLMFYPETELAKAVFRCNYEKTKQLVDQGANINSQEGDKVTPLHILVLKINKPHYVLDNVCINTLKLLLQSGVYINAQDRYGRTPLHCSKNILVMDLLLQAKANPNIKNDKGRTPLYQFINSNNYIYSTHRMELLLKHGARVDIKDNQGNTPLSLATGKTLELFKKYEKRQKSDTGEK